MQPGVERGSDESPFHGGPIKVRIFQAIPREDADHLSLAYSGLLERSDQVVYSQVEPGKGYSLSSADKGLLSRMKKGISVNDVCERSSLVTAEFLQNEFVGHFFLLVSGQRPALIESSDAENLKNVSHSGAIRLRIFCRANSPFCQFLHSQCF